MKTQEQKLASEQCRRILQALVSGPKSAIELVGLTKLTAGSIAKHIQVLLEADMVSESSAGLISSKR